MDKSAFKQNILFYLLVLGFLVYGLFFIYNSSLVFQGTRYFVLSDDAMISMQYARNLAAGHGPVWNPGEKVEGYTNLFWVLYMALWHLLPIPLAKMSLPIQLTGLLLVAGSLFLVKNILRQFDASRTAALAAVFLTATYYPILFWSLKGMETSLLILLTLAMVWLANKCLAENRLNVWLWLIGGGGLLVRSDFAVIYLTALFFLLFFQPEMRRDNRRWGLGIFFLVLGGHTLFRYLYYGDILPNTYYLKMTGFPEALRFNRGWIFTLEFLKNIQLLIIPLIFLAGAPRSAKIKIQLLLALLLAQMLFNIYVGGDAFEDRVTHQANRFLAMVMPLFFILLAAALDFILKKKRFGRSVTIGATLVIFIALLGPGGIRSPVLHDWIRGRGIFFENEKNLVILAYQIKSISQPSARIAVAFAGIIPYFSERPGVDLLGINDANIARQPARDETMWIGHNKYDYNYSIQTRQPDIIAQLWNLDAAGDWYLRQNYFPFNFPDYWISHDPKGQINLSWQNMVWVNKESDGILPGLIRAAPDTRK